MLRRNFEEGFDFSSLKMKSTGGRPSIHYQLAIDCFKSLCMMADTDTGKRVRKYYLQIEKEFFNQRNHQLALDNMDIDTAKQVFEKTTDVLRRYDEDQKMKIQIFFDQRIIVSENKADWVTTLAVYEMYVREYDRDGVIAWCHFTYHFRQMFPNVGYGQKKVDGQGLMVFYGIKLLY